MTRGKVINATLGTYRAGEELVTIHNREWRNSSSDYPAFVFRPGMTGTASTYFGPKFVWVDGTPVDVGHNDFTDMLSERGLFCAWTDFGDPSSWGNPDSLLAGDSIWTWLNVLGGTDVASNGLILGGGSMGAIPVMNWARANPEKVRAMITWVGPLDLQRIYDDNPANARPLVEAAYGVTYPQPIPNIEEHSPILYAGDVSWPIYAVCGNTDTWGENTEAWEAYASVVGDDLITVAGYDGPAPFPVGSGHDLGDDVDNEAIWDWLKQYLV